MQTDLSRVSLFVAVLVAALAAALIDTPWLRVGLVLAMVAYVASRALAAGGAPAAKKRGAAPAGDDRRSDSSVRQHIQQLLDLIRDFYSTCHMVAIGQLSPAKAKQKARDVEEKLNIMMKDMLDRIDGEQGDGGSSDDDRSS